ncbi:MAG: hypothetical protein ACYST6_11925 [Planctomycetota bacterium]
MRNKIAVCCVSALILLSSAACSHAGSIWAKRDKNMRDWYADDVARNIGDVLTIRISEDRQLCGHRRLGPECSVKQRAEKQGRL